MQNEKHAEQYQILQKYDFELKKHIYVRIKASFFLLKTLLKSFNKQRKNEAFKMIFNYEEIQKQKTRKESFSQPEIILKSHNFIASGLTEKKCLKG